MTQTIDTIKNFAARKRREFILRKTAAQLVSVAFVYLLISATLSAAFAIFPWTALPMAWTFATMIALAAILFLPLVFFIRKPTLLDIAANVENRSGIKHCALSLSLELSAQKNVGGSASLKELTYNRAAEQIEKFTRVKFSFANRYICVGAILLLFINACIAVAAQNQITNYWRLPLTLISGATFRTDPGNVTVKQNSSVTLALRGAAQHYPTARLDMWHLNSTTRTRHFLNADSSFDFSFFVDSVKESFVYQFSLSSPLPPDTVTVAPPPMLRSLQVSLSPPRHTRLPPRALPLGQGNVTAYIGTEVSVTLESTILSEAGIIFDGGDTIKLDAQGSVAEGKFIVTKSTEYTFYLIDTLGQASLELPKFVISALRDELPVARIIRPGTNKILTTAQVETLFVEGIDDFGISKMELRWRYNDDLPSDPHEVEDLSERGSPPLIRKSVVWNLHELELYPGDTVFYWLWVRDNRAGGRAQTAMSDTFWFRVPSFEEIHKAIAMREEYAQEKIGEVRRRQDDIASAVERLLKTASGTRELSWDQKRVVDDIRKQVEAQADSLQKAFDALAESMEELRKDGKINDELYEKMEQIQNAVRELIKEFGEELFKSNTNEELTMNEMRQAANRLQNMLPELSERLDQTLAFLEKIKQEKELSDLAARAENLSSEQLQLAMSSDSQTLDRRQEELIERIDSFNEDVRNFFDERGGELPQSLQSVQQLSSEMKSERANQSKQNAMSRELLSLSEQLKSNLASNMAERMEKDRRIILQMAHDALSLEEWQQTIRTGAAGTADDRSVALAQQALSNSIRLSLAKSDSLTFVNVRTIREIVRVYRNAMAMSSAVISSLDKSDGVRQMEQSVLALREISILMLSIAGSDDDGDGSGGAGGMMSGLRRASGKQAALNSAMGDMLQQLLGGRPQGRGRGQEGDGQEGWGEGGSGIDGAGNNQLGGESGGGGGEREREARRQARAAQEAIADEIRRLADAYGSESGESMEKRVRELEAEARRLAQLLENPPADIIDQQDKFLSRMLQSTLSLNRKDEGSEERKGTQSQTIFAPATTQSSGAASHNADNFHLLRRRAFEDNFPEDYRGAIRNYFDALGEMMFEQR